jgi:hypothetical protein
MMTIKKINGLILQLEQVCNEVNEDMIMSNIKLLIEWKIDICRRCIDEIEFIESIGKNKGFLTVKNADARANLLWQREELE